jgi:hypothetical protein
MKIMIFQTTSQRPAPWARHLYPGVRPLVRARRPTLLITALAATVALGGCGEGGTPRLGPTITLAEEGASRPTAAIDPRTGTAYIAWVGTTGGTADVYLTRIEPGSTAAPRPIRVNDIAGDAAPHDQAPARVALGPDGRVFVAWQNNTHIPGRRFPASDLRFAHSTDGGHTFHPTITINPDPGDLPGSHTFHDMMVAADGSIIVSWIESGESSEIRLATSTDGGRSFGPARLVDEGACPCCRTALAIAADGTAYIAWRKILDGEIRDIVVARVENDDTNPGQPRRAHADDWRLDACPHAGPALATDPADRLHLAWYTGEEGRAGLYYAVTSDRAETFTEPIPILTGAGIPPSQVGIAVDEKGIIGISWEDRRPRDQGVRFARLRRDGTVGRALAIPGTAPALAMAGGTTILAWLDGDSLRARFDW